MTTTVCKAKFPDECRYHGTRSASHTRLLRDKLVVAREVYKVAQVMSEQLEAYSQLKDAEADYYSTDEGRTSLVEHINKTDDQTSRTTWIGILEAADQKREFHEQMTTSMWTQEKAAPPARVALLFTEKPVSRFSNGNEVIPLSTGKYRTGEEYHFEWDATRGNVFYEESDDIDSMRTLGRASTIEEAKAMSNDWYNTQWHSRSNSN